MVAALDSADISALTFLVVEDDSFQRWALEQMLLRAGAARVASVADGEAARRAIALDSFDVVLCDLDMPRMDGIELIRRIGEEERAPALIVCSGHDELLLSAAAGLAQSQGIRILDAITKPVTLAKLFTAIKGHRLRDRAPRKQVPDPASHSVDVLLEALRAGEICAWFQPTIDLSTMEIVGGEALARWTGHDGSTLLPLQFLPAFERAGLMPQLTRHIADQAFSACAAWRREGIRASASVNIDRTALAQESFVDEITTAVARHGLYPKDVTLEVTESAATADSAREIAALTRLRMRGFGLAIDDFGTGYSSMTQLARVPFTELKIDQSFVQGATGKKRCLAVMRSCAQIATELGIRSVAEGVETDDQWKLALDLGCSGAQGWRFGKALPWAQFIALARRPRPSLPRG